MLLTEMLKSSLHASIEDEEEHPQDLSDIISDYHVFLSLDFESTRKLAALLRDQDCDSFLYEEIEVDTEVHEPPKYNDDLAQDLRDCAHALAE
ncbi:hypothetical protein N0V90_012570 [Kalmusia sp. IMI 367209]|nr:hypothetical protein N0V90_012570 [Kalmusia sp. IMI 367209]